MIDARAANARQAGSVGDAVSRAVVIVGDSESSEMWRQALGTALPEGAAIPVLPEQGRKGNFLGALQAYRRIADGSAGVGSLDSIEQLVMFVGTGSRLSPITQSLRNMKAALRLPSGDPSHPGMTVGEAAIRSSAPWIRALRESGFAGLVVRWGDEIIIPSTDLAAGLGSLAEVDAVRFGYYAQPTELLATQKEWLLADEEGKVSAEFPRQSLDRLLDKASGHPSAQALHVNLGSFAISSALLDALGAAFGDLTGPDEVAANWDPYLWMALHSSSPSQWEEDSCPVGAEAPKDFAQLRETIPDFWSRVQRAKELLAEETGRPFAARILDFGDPYWFDAGNHASLRSGINDIFSASRDGEAIRAFLQLPEELAQGGSLVLGSQLPAGIGLRNSIVLGSSIEDPGSSIERSIVIDSRLGYLRADPGSVVIECDSESLEIDGPEGFAVRLQGPARVGGDEVTAEVPTVTGPIRLSHFDPSIVVDSTRFETPTGTNPISFKTASELVAELVQEQAEEE